jgi:hypothetical protein
VEVVPPLSPPEQASRAAARAMDRYLMGGTNLP